MTLMLEARRVGVSVLVGSLRGDLQGRAPAWEGEKERNREMGDCPWFSAGPHRRQL